MNIKIRKVVGVAVVCVGLVTQTVQAALLENVAVTELGSNYTQLSSRILEDTLDGNKTSTSPNGTAWLSGVMGDVNTETGELGSPQTVIWTFDSLSALDTVDVWNYNEPGSNTTRGARSINVSYSANSGGSWTSLGTHEIAQAPGTTGITPTSIDFGGVQASNVKFEITQNWTADLYVGLNEVEFYGAPTVTWDTSQADLQVVDFSTEYPGREATNTLDGIIHTTSYTGMWLSGLYDTTPDITFQLTDGPATVYYLDIWNHNNSTPRGIETFEVLTSLNGIDFTKAINPATGTTTFTLGEANGDAALIRDRIFLQGSPTAAYVQINALTNQSSEYYGGLTEVQIIIPEPSSLALLLLAVAGIVNRRRRIVG